MSELFFSFWPVATEDDTRVDILFPDDKDVEVDYLKHKYEGNDELQVTMDRLDTFQVNHRSWSYICKYMYGSIYI